MKFLNFRKFHKGQSGFVLIDLLTAIIITGIISLGISSASFQLINTTSKNRNFTMASRNAMNALHWIGRDTVMAQNIDGTEGFPTTSNLSLSWNTWDNTECTVSYNLQDGELCRFFSDGTQETKTVVAEDINSSPDKTYCSTDNGTLTFVITSSVGEGYKTIDVTRTRDIVSRPRL
jgi:type II secretory pathway pseudopilin PulG